jgi:hypothetical protein
VKMLKRFIDKRDRAVTNGRLTEPMSMQSPGPSPSSERGERRALRKRNPLCMEIMCTKNNNRSEAPRFCNLCESDGGNLKRGETNRCGSSPVARDQSGVADTVTRHDRKTYDQYIARRQDEFFFQIVNLHPLIMTLWDNSLIAMREKPLREGRKVP